MNWSYFLQKCPACLIHLTWMSFEIGGMWLYSCCFLGCCFQDLFKTARSILVQFASSFSVSILLASMWCIHTVVVAQPQILNFIVNLITNMDIDIIISKFDLSSRAISFTFGLMLYRGDIPDPLSPLLPIVHRLWQVFRATSRILT